MENIKKNKNIKDTHNITVGQEQKFSILKHNWYFYKNIVLSIIYIPINIIFKIIILSMGWSLINKKIFKKLNKYDRSVLIFSHTSYADFYILALYLLAYLPKLNFIRILVKPQPFKYAGFILIKLGAIPATRIDDKNGGSVEKIVYELNKYKKFAFLISPKGTIIKREWRSGYYYIAKKLSAHLMTVGLDYESKCVKISKAISYNNDKTIIEDFLKNELKDIVPLFPEEEIIEIRKHNSNNRNIITNYSYIILLLVVIISLIALLFNLIMMNLITMDLITMDL